MVVPFGGGEAQIAVALEMEFLQIIARIVAGRRRVEQALLAAAVPPRIDRREIDEEVGGAIERRDRIADILGRERVISGLDVAPVLGEQRLEIGEEAPAVRHRPPAQRCRQRLRPAEARGQQLLAEIPGDPRGPHRVERELVEGRRHAPSTYRVRPAWQWFAGRRHPCRGAAGLSRSPGDAYYAPASDVFGRPMLGDAAPLSPPGSQRGCGRSGR